MKLIFAALFCAGVLVAASSAACELLQARIIELPPGCRHGREFHPPESKWRTRNCYTCTCSKNGDIECCSLPRPVESEDCKYTFHRKSCTYELIPNDKCIHEAWVG
ncbi:beta-microseminoprotein-like [Hyperolius riggenbachi]|uniref:beta-microseminoprotein-like n=1 Tax=Hyperolius riggenbachi TaxID=752182 RepID=UPI0035A29B8E